jgi:hypothetical protein
MFGTPSDHLLPEETCVVGDRKHIDHLERIATVTKVVAMASDAFEAQLPD